MAWPAASFASPPALLRGAPFWAWNGRLDRSRLVRQIGWFAEMGFGGFVMHARTGLATPYLSQEFLDRVRDCVAEAGRHGMLAWIYDEDRWPSGFAGGLVTSDPEHRSRHLLVTRRRPTGTPLARWAVLPAADGRLAAYRRLGGDESTPPGWDELWGLLEQSRPGESGSPASIPGGDDHGTSQGASVWYNGQTYVDTLSPDAIRRFIEVTHERYRDAVGGAFGSAVPAVFTDEPQVALPAFPRDAADPADCRLPWTTGFAASHAVAHASDPLDDVPALLWDAPGSAAARWRYWDHVAERFAAAYADQLGAWCGRNGLALTGHVMNEHALHLQVASVGEAMRPYRSFHIPGIDLLCDGLELLTAKQCQSAKHQAARADMASELYGVTDWDFPFSGHKGQGEWQAALGVTIRHHHLAWMGMAGEAKRDYPASISYQSTWFREYRQVEERFARIAVALRLGAPRVRVAIVHPIESAWTETGPLAEADRIVRRDCRLKELLAWLLHGLIDCDLVSESMLLGSPIAADGRLHAGAMAYDAVLAPDLATMRSSTLDRLEAMSAGGGLVRFIAAAPALVDALPDDRAIRLAGRVGILPWRQQDVLDALEPLRDVAVRSSAGADVPGLLHQLRHDGEDRVLFVCNTSRTVDHPGVVIRVRGAWSVAACDPGSGSQALLASVHREGWTEVTADLHAAGSVLLHLRPGQERMPVAHARPRRPEQPIGVGAPRRIVLSEPNVLLLDRPAWRTDGGAWHAATEILRADNAIRAGFGLPPRNGDAVQPWADAAPDPVCGRIALRYGWRQDVTLAGLRLALEEPAAWSLHVDGRLVPCEDAGWWVDEDIRLLRIPDLGPGQHTLELQRPYSRRTACERIYLLGGFSVRIDGLSCSLGPPVATLRWGDWVQQGLPFYCGDVSYLMDIAGDGGAWRLRAPAFAAPLLRASLDGEPRGSIAWSPWTCELGRIEPGRHQLDITAYGHRRNGFGPLHAARDLPWVGPNAWRTTGDGWCEDWRMRPTGILAEPLLERSMEGTEPTT